MVDQLALKASFLCLCHEGEGLDLGQTPPHNEASQDGQGLRCLAVLQSTHNAAQTFPRKGTRNEVTKVSAN